MASKYNVQDWIVNGVKTACRAALGKTKATDLCPCFKLF
jgi:hypothetical protein